jgi:cellulose synthase (UDP-forming)
MSEKKDYSKIPTLIFIFTSILLIMGMLYISWRWIYTLNVLESPFVTFWSYSLLGAEIITLIVFTNFTMILIKTLNLKKITPDNKLQQDYCKDVYNDANELVTFKNYCPSVDIFICTLNETADILSTTISACKNIDYPNKNVYVLDDGRRKFIEELTQMLECNYITRETNKGYKAGNINNALSQTNSDIVVIFDADHVPASTFLRETVYNFVDEKVALVQTPQHFCNHDAFQKNLAVGKFLSNEQDIFYRIIEPGLNEFDSVFCGGTNILLRRKHLETVGNFPENTITEDSLLGLKFHSYGFKVIYYNRPIAVGLAASSFEEYIKQRCRWAKGNVQILFNPENWQYYKKLKPVQAFFFLSGVFYFFTPIARLIFLFAPVMFLFFDISPVLILFYQIFAFQFCYFTLKFAFIFTNCIKIKNVIFADVYDLVTSIFTIGSILEAIFIPKSLTKFKFSVTKKDFKDEKSSSKYMASLVFIFTILIAAELQGIYDLLYSEVYSVLAIVANLFWNALNIFVMYFGIQVVDEKPEKRLYQRIKTDEKVVFEDTQHHKFQTQIEDISRSGIKFSINEKQKTPPSEKDLLMNLEDGTEEIELLNCDKEKGNYTCKSIFKNPISMLNLNKIKIKRLNKYVRLAYKKPDSWDDYFKKK